MSSPHDECDSIPTPVTPSPTWRVGKITISRGLLEFLPNVIFLTLLTVTALVGVFKDPDNPMWSQLLFLVAGVIVPNPKVPKDKEETAEETTAAASTTATLIDYFRRHYTTTIAQALPTPLPTPLAQDQPVLG